MISFVVFSHVKIAYEKAVLVYCTDDECGYNKR